MKDHFHVTFSRTTGNASVHTVTYGAPGNDKDADRPPPTGAGGDWESGVESDPSWLPLRPQAQDMIAPYRTFRGQNVFGARSPRDEIERSHRDLWIRAF